MDVDGVARPDWRTMESLRYSGNRLPRYYNAISDSAVPTPPFQIPETTALILFLQQLLCEILLPWPGRNFRET